MSDEIIYEVRDGIAWLTINRPEARNALNKVARDAFRDAAESFVADRRGARADRHRRRRQGVLRRRRSQGDGRTRR